MSTVSKVVFAFTLQNKPNMSKIHMIFSRAVLFTPKVHLTQWLCCLTFWSCYFFFSIIRFHFKFKSHVNEVQWSWNAAKHYFQSAECELISIFGEISCSRDLVLLVIGTITKFLDWCTDSPNAWYSFVYNNQLNRAA